MPNAVVQGTVASTRSSGLASHRRDIPPTSPANGMDRGRDDLLCKLDAFSRTLREAQNRYCEHETFAPCARAPAPAHVPRGPRAPRARERRRLPPRVATLPTTPPPLDDVRIVRLPPRIVPTLPKTRAAFFRAIASGTQPFENGVKMTALLMEALNVPMSDARRKQLIAVGRAIDDTSGAIPQVLKYRLILEVAGVTADYLEQRPPDPARLSRLIDSVRVWQPVGAVAETSLSRATKPEAARHPENHAAGPGADVSVKAVAVWPGPSKQRPILRPTPPSGAAHPDVAHAASEGAEAIRETLEVVPIEARATVDAPRVRQPAHAREDLDRSHEQLFRAENERGETMADRMSSDPRRSSANNREHLMGSLAGLARIRHRTAVDRDPGSVVFVDNVPLRHEFGASGAWGWRELPLEGYQVDLPPRRPDGRLFRHQFKRYLPLDGQTYAVQRLGKGQYAIVHPDGSAWPSIPIEEWHGTWRRRAPHSLSPEASYRLGSDGIYRSGRFKAVFYDGALHPVLRDSIVDESRILPLATSLDAPVSGVDKRGVLHAGTRQFIEGKQGYYPVVHIGEQTFAVNGAGRPLFWMKFRDGQFRVAERLNDESSSRLSVMRDGDVTVRTPSSSSLQSHYRALDENGFLVARPILLKAMKAAMRSLIQMRPLYQRADAVHLGNADVDLLVMRERIDAVLRREGGRGEKSVIAWQFRMSRATRKIYRQNLPVGRSQQVKCHEAADMFYYVLSKRGFNDHILLIQFVQLPGSGLTHVQLLYADDTGWLRRAFGDLDKRGGASVDDLREYTRASFEHLLTSAARDARESGSQVALIDGWGAEKLVVISEQKSSAEIAASLSANLRAARFDLGARDSYRVTVVR